MFPCLSRPLAFLTFLLLFAMLVPLASAQVLTGTKQISLMANGGQYTFSSSDTNSTKSIDKFLTLSGRFGISIYEGLFIEPEVIWTAQKESEPGLMVNANGMFQFELPLEAGLALRPFVLAGYGIGTGVPFYGIMALRRYDSKGWDVAGPNLGAGTLITWGPRAALRMEYRWQQYKYDYEYESFSGRQYSETLTYEFSQVMLGVTILFPPNTRR